MSTESHPNPAIARCLAAREEAMQKARAAGESDYGIRSAGQDAYRTALPSLEGRENVRAFIACVAYGLLLDVFIESQAKLLLYAAQVATSASRQPARAASA